MRVFDTGVQHLKYKVLRELARQTWQQNDPFMVFNEIANTIVKKGEPTMSCCIYKDRAIVAERMRKALGGSKDDPNIIQIIDIACDDCPEAGYVVTDLCRGCVAHNCHDACPRDAVEFGNDQKAHINKEKCIECGKCAKVCPYDAIANLKRPCERTCKVDAIHSIKGVMMIDPEKCTRCGECVYKCPFGATLDISSITDIIKMIQDSKGGIRYDIHAIVAPAIAGQFKYAKTGQIITAMKKLGFTHVEEAALGADIVAYHEAEELREKGFLTSSCCPAFVSYIHSKFPDLADNVSTNLSPMAALAKALKEEDPSCKVVFVGPCIAKKGEIRKPEVEDIVDYVMTFEELQALIDSRDISVNELPESEFTGASPFGRKFARSGGVTEAVAQAIKEQGADDFEFKPIVCDGIDKCKSALMRARKGVLPFNFIEGMICEGGCIGGAACLTHGSADVKAVDDYGDSSDIADIRTSIEKYL